MKRVMLKNKHGDKFGPYEIGESGNVLVMGGGTSMFYMEQHLNALGFSVEEYEEPKTVTKEQFRLALPPLVQVNMNDPEFSFNKSLVDIIWDKL